VKVGTFLLKSRGGIVGIVGLFSYVYIDKSGKKNSTLSAAAKMGILTQFIEV